MTDHYEFKYCNQVLNNCLRKSEINADFEAGDRGSGGGLGPKFTTGEISKILESLPKFDRQSIAW